VGPAADGGADVEVGPAVDVGSDADVGPEGWRKADSGEIRRLKQVSPIWIVDLEEDWIFSGELGRDDVLGVDRRVRRSPLLVHPVTSRIRHLTLLESMEALPVRALRHAAAVACPLLLDLGDTRRVLYTLLAGTEEAKTTG
jgi:hypothetical protein